MILAFENSIGRVSAYWPVREVEEIASYAGLSLRDLCCVSVPGGASRHASAKALVRYGDLATLYGDAGGLAQTTVVVGPNRFTAWLLPPRPIYYDGSGNSAYLVEAVDSRYWWQRTFVNTQNNSPIGGPSVTSDGRRSSAIASLDTLAEIVPALIAQLPAGTGTIDVSAFSPNEVLLSRVSNIRLTPDLSVGLALDMVLSACGFVLRKALGASESGYVVSPIGSNFSNLINLFRAQVYAFGVEPRSTSAATGDAWVDGMLSVAGAQVNRMPNKVGVSFPFKTVEGNATAQQPAGREFAVSQTLTTDLSRSTIGSLYLREPRPLVSKYPTPTTFDNATPTNNTINSPSPPAWNWTTYAQDVANLLAARCSRLFGTTVLRGWGDVTENASLPSAFITMAQFTVARRSRDIHDGGETLADDELVPIRVCTNDPADWLLGPDGLGPTEPSQIVQGTLTGNLTARRLYNGMTQIDVPAPLTRVFPARITGASQIGTTTTTWTWLYGFEEVEPTASQASAPAYVIPTGTIKRIGQAVNLMEAGNFYAGAGNAANVVAPGVLQSDNANATIEALPIRNGSIVMMCEQTITLNMENDGRPFWFSVPNAVKFTCIP